MFNENLIMNSNETIEPRLLMHVIESLAIKLALRKVFLSLATSLWNRERVRIS